MILLILNCNDSNLTRGWRFLNSTLLKSFVYGFKNMFQAILVGNAVHFALLTPERSHGCLAASSCPDDSSCPVVADEKRRWIEEVEPCCKVHNQAIRN